MSKAALKRIQASHDRISSRLDGRALKRVEAWLTGNNRLVPYRDLRDVLALAKEAAEHERRIRLARRSSVFTEEQRCGLREYARYYLDERRVIGEWYVVAKAVRAMLQVDDALRKPLPRSRR